MSNDNRVRLALWLLWTMGACFGAAIVLAVFQEPVVFAVVLLVGAALGLVIDRMMAV